MTVREDAFVRAPKRAEHPHVHRIPLPTSVTIAKRPSDGGGMGGENHIFTKNGSKIFFAGGVDTIPIKRSDLPVEAKLQQIKEALDEVVWAKSKLSKPLKEQKSL